MLFRSNDTATTEIYTLSQLIITPEQRKELSAKLEQTFGAVLKDEMPDVSPDASGWLLYEFINRKEWKLQPGK